MMRSSNSTYTALNLDSNSFRTRPDYLLVDGTERPIHRPADAEEQKSSYSGKKKCTAKNMILCAPTKQILFATTTNEGSAQDKAIADDAALDLPSNVVILADSGFQGFSAGQAR